MGSGETREHIRDVVWRQITLRDHAADHGKKGLVQRLAGCGHLLRHLLAVGVAFEQLLDATQLTLDTLEAQHQCTLANGVVEVTSRRTGESVEMTPEAAVARIAEIYAGV